MDRAPLAPVTPVAPGAPPEQAADLLVPIVETNRISADGACIDPALGVALAVPCAPSRLPPETQPAADRSQRAFAEFRARTRFPALDGIRAFSILAVVWHHTAGPLGGVPATANGFLGVDAFFVLSGFLIVTLCLRERDRTGDLSLRRFYARRTLRIFPIYYLLLAVVLVLVTVVRPESDMRGEFLRELPFHLTYTSNWIETTTFLAIAWSLATEEQFYLLWPPLEKWFPRGVLLALFAVLAASQLVNFGVLDGVLADLGLPREQYAILQVTLTPIALGVLLAHALHARRGFGVLHALFARRSTLWLVLAALFVLVNVPGDLSGLPRLAIQVALALCLAGCVVDQGHPLARAAGIRVLCWIGSISYGMYLYHQLVRHGAAELLREADVASPLALFGVTAVLTIAVAALSFRCVEAPIARWKQRRLAR